MFKSNCIVALDRQDLIYNVTTVFVTTGWWSSLVEVDFFANKVFIFNKKYMLQYINAIYDP